MSEKWEAMTPQPGDAQATDNSTPRYYANGIHIAMTGYDMTVTFLELDPTILPDDQVGPHVPVPTARVQVTLAVGCAKALIPGLVRAISDFEQQFGIVPAPGFEEGSKA